jgi:hypothetical protein
MDRTWMNIGIYAFLFLVRKEGTSGMFMLGIYLISF